MENKDYKKEFMKCLDSIEYGRNRYEIFQDFLTLATSSFHNVFAKDKEVEKQYMDIVSKYKKPNKFAELLAITACALETKTQDFLGEVFMMSGFGNVRAGQFFTPYHISEFMAGITLDDNGIKQQIEEQGYVTITDPCCGSGVMIIAASDVIRKCGYNPQKYMKFQGIDIDLRCCQMAYIQTSLLGLKGEIIHGDSLAIKYWNKFITPMSFIPIAA